MTDRELLELAAKAAGYPIEPRTEWIEVQKLGQKEPERLPGNVDFYAYGNLWNPLTDDGDALRLAVRLEMDLFIRGGRYTEAVCPMHKAIQEAHSIDTYAATRRAIVRAAAEIGKAL